MKRSFTLTAFILVCLFTTTVNAQVLENFNNGVLPTGTCWGNTNLSLEDAPGKDNQTLSATGKGYALATFTTPFINLPDRGTFSFRYNSTENNANPDLSIRVSIITQTGVTTLLATLTPQGKDNYRTYTSPELTAGAYRIKIELVNAGGSLGNTFVSFDDFTATGNYAANGCNYAPKAVDDQFTSVLLASPFNENVITNSVGGTDSDADGNQFTAAIVTQPTAAQGTVTMNTNGSFTFTPAAGFAGGPVIFTYRLTDNGSPAATSGSATVTINYPAPVLTPMPVKLISFSGSIAANKGQLKWTVADNETGNYFQVMRSADGKNFTEAGTVLSNGKLGAESYSFADVIDWNGTAFYKLKIVNKDNSIAYSQVIVLKSSQEGSGSDVLTLLQNPMQSQLAFSYQTQTAGPALVNLYSMAGVKLMSFVTYLQPGTNTVQQALPASVGSGTYVLEVQHSGQRRAVKPTK